MLDQIAEPKPPYGGSWTIEKLEILEKYLDAYTTALKNKPQEQCMYETSNSIDSFSLKATRVDARHWRVLKKTTSAEIFGLRTQMLTRF